MTDLVFPRIVYRGEPDVLGLGTVGETQRVDTAEHLDAALRGGWRLTRELPVETSDDDETDTETETESETDAEPGSVTSSRPARQPRTRKKKQQ